jgi:predicted RNA-binding protein YlxR (DUF448 family)
VSGGRKSAAGQVDSGSAGYPAGGSVRTCVGCRQRASRTDLLRVVVIEGVIVPDPGGWLPGRGAHLHRDPECLDLADRRRTFHRALRQPGALDLSALRDYLATGATTTTGAPRMTQP